MLPGLSSDTYLCYCKILDRSCSSIGRQYKKDGGVCRRSVDKGNDKRTCELADEIDAAKSCIETCEARSNGSSSLPSTGEDCNKASEPCRGDCTYFVDCAHRVVRSQPPTNSPSVEVNIVQAHSPTYPVPLDSHQIEHRARLLDAR